MVNLTIPISDAVYNGIISSMNMQEISSVVEDALRKRMAAAQADFAGKQAGLFIPQSAWAHSHISGLEYEDQIREARPE